MRTRLHLAAALLGLLVCTYPGTAQDPGLASSISTEEAFKRAADSGCKALDTPLAKRLGYWIMTIYAPPSVLPALTAPWTPEGQDVASELAGYLSKYWEAGNSSLSISDKAFAAVGEFTVAYINGGEPAPGEPLARNTVRLTLINATGPYFEMQNAPKPSGGATTESMQATFGPSVQVYYPEGGLFARVKARAAASDGNDTKVVMSQALFCDKATRIINIQLPELEGPLETVEDLMQLSPALAPVLRTVGADLNSTSTLDDEPLPWESHWVRRTYWPTSFEGQPGAGYIIANVVYPTEGDAAKGTSPGKAEILLLAHEPSGLAYAEALQEYAVALQKALEDMEADLGQ